MNRSKDRYCHVIAVGGRIPGAIDEIEAARAGTKALMIEHYGFLSGRLKAPEAGRVMIFRTGELIERLKRTAQLPGHLFDSTGFTYAVAPFDVDVRQLQTTLRN
ncbi:hypothetical protein MLD52_01415 [Puniceicoccaceae bacterium K14]|nr:hypothetical protein [Puniceicoccaceae bacterium K14]